MTRFDWMTIFGVLATACVCAAEPMQPYDLRCGQRVNPLGIEGAPRLSWLIDSPVRGQKQSAYQVLVASSEVTLETDKGDLWDSGKVSSDHFNAECLAPAVQKSRQRCWWKVRVWDKDGKPGTWSEPAYWTMGLLRKDDWKGQWIGYDAGGETYPNLKGCSWVWFPETGGNETSAAPKAHRFFRHVVTLPAGVRVARAPFVISADDHFTFWVNGKQPGRSFGRPDAWHEPQLLDLAPYLVEGPNALCVEVSNDAEGPAGVIGRGVIETIGADQKGASLPLEIGANWKCNDKPAGAWQKPDYDDAKWKPVKILGPLGMQPWGAVADSVLNLPPSPILRKSFELNKPVAHAALSVCGLGYHVLHLNGARVGDHVLDPLFTRYDRRVLYVTHDVTKLLRDGKNALGVELGNGWLNEHTSSAWNFDTAPWRMLPRMLLQLDVTFADGSTAAIVSDGSWKASTGPLVYDAIRKGETVDARLEKDGWDRADYSDTNWAAAQIVAAPKGVLSAQMAPPIKVMQTLKPVKISSPSAGAFIVDFGQNIAGRVRLTVSGPAGTQVTVRHGERLNADGTLDQTEIAEHVRGPNFSTDRYILKGKGTEVFAPEFVYHGFQYVELTGFPGTPSEGNITAEVLQSSFDSAGSFACSNELLNAIERCAKWSFMSNFVGYPTDCPHREKNGWTGDAHLASEMGLLHFRAEAAYEKWMLDMYDEQRESGELPGIVPTGGWGYAWGNGPAWDSAYLIIPWNIYLYRGDTHILATHYDRFKRYVDYLTSKSKDGIVGIGLGDWAPAKTKTPEAITSTGYYYIDTLIVAKSAALLGKTEDAAKYSAQAAAIRTAFNAKFYDAATGKVDKGSQCAQSCALYQGLAESAEVEKIVKVLVENVDAENGHLDAGILGTKYLLHALTDNGRADAAYRIATQTTAPSWGAWIRQGATTLWEQWDGKASRNHVMYGDISAWFIQDIAGIRPDPEGPGFKRFIVRPHPVGELTFAVAEHLSPQGRICSAWELKEDALKLIVSVPVGSLATVYFPAKSQTKVLENGKPVAQAEGVKFLRMDGAAAVYEADAGQYVFTTK